jgi:flagellar basal body rod protein FlgC
MLRSMFTAISSLNLHQYYMDVVADNLANANTPTYKSSRISFQDQFAQVLWNVGSNGQPGGITRLRWGWAQPGSHFAELHPGDAAEHRPRHRPGHPGRRLLHLQQR